MYAIQEPIVGLLAGLMQGICQIRLNRKNPNVIYDIIATQISLVFFCVFSLVELLLWVDQGNIAYFNTYKIVAIVLIVSYFIVIETVVIVYIHNLEKNYAKIITFTYSNMLVTIITVIFAFLLGPISAVEYLHYINGVYPENYIKYGTIFYLIPRVIEESIKSPVETLVLTSSVFIAQPLLENLKNVLSNQW